MVRGMGEIRLREWSGRVKIGAARGTLLALAATSLLGCAATRETTAQQAAHPVVLSLANAGTLPLRCTILFGHWVEQGVGEIPPGEVLEIEVRRQAGDGALFVPRGDGRRMMVENLICGPPTDWWTRRADLSLLPVRSGTAPAYAARCRLDVRARCSAFVPAGS